ncbi:MAG: TetR/AcrR family transcriptional regulator [Acidimicrobiales bacterium]
MVANTGSGRRLPSALETRIHLATLRCLARWGVSKTTLEDVAREAGCSRATIYRAVSGGKATLLNDVVDREIARFLAEVDAAIAEETNLEDLLVAAVTTAARFIVDHEAFQFLLAHEPDVVLPHLSFDRLGEAVQGAGAFFAPHLARCLPAGTDTSRAGEWVARLVATYSLLPSDVVDVRQDTHARHLVRTFVLPGLDRLAEASSTTGV